LVLGYGNTDRQDDGVAWHVLHALSNSLGTPVVTAAEDLPAGSPVGLLFQLQLTPELVEAFTDYDQIVFIDAQVGAAGDSQSTVHVQEVRQQFQSSPLSHHLTPQACMALLGGVYQHPARGTLVSITGRQFGFGRELSPQTAEAAQQAAGVVAKIIMG
jgi:hydrogenase maturation protease